MASFVKVLKVAQQGYYDREDYPPYALMSWDDRHRWTAYLTKINVELDEAVECNCGPAELGPHPVTDHRFKEDVHGDN